MNIYTTDKIRNVVLLGHGGSGKTSLTEAMAYLAGITSRMGKVTDGNTVSDYGKEEQKRQISINTSVVPIEWNGVKINILDTPGYFDFVGEVEEAVKAAAEEAGASGDGAPKSKTKMWISGIILLGVVACMALGLKNLPLHTAAVTGAILCVITGCLKEKEAYAGIDWVTIFLFAGMLSVASAMEKTGAGKMIADAVVSMMGDNPNPYVLTAVLFLISNVLTQFMSNTASAALLAPIGISIAQSVGADPKPVLMALGIAASMAFATPMATPPNTLVLGPGGFSFNDYVKVGVPMCLISLVACVIIIPIFWPF